MTPAERAVDEIINDLNDRRGLHIYSLDKDIQKQIRAYWLAIIERAIRTAPLASEVKT